MKYIAQIIQYDMEGYPIGGYPYPYCFNSEEELEKALEKEGEFTKVTHEIHNSVLLENIYYLEGDDCHYITKDIDFDSFPQAFDTLTIFKVDEYNE